VLNLVRAALVHEAWDLTLWSVQDKQKSCERQEAPSGLWPKEASRRGNGDGPFHTLIFLMCDG